MDGGETTKEEARRVIAVACRMLRQVRCQTPRFSRGPLFLTDDCLRLLEDATRAFCASVSRELGEAPETRWSEALPQTLFEHPEVCDEVLAMVAREDYPRHLFWKPTAA